jgi:hypothetical protein
LKASIQSEKDALKQKISGDKKKEESKSAKSAGTKKNL